MGRSVVAAIVTIAVVGGIVGGLVVFVVKIRKAQANLEATAERICHLAARDHGMLAVGPYFVLVPKRTPRFLGILIPGQDGVAIFAKDGTGPRRIAYKDMAVVELPGDPLYGQIVVRKVDGSAENLKFGQDTALLGNGTFASAGTAVANLKRTQSRFAQILVQHGVRVVQRTGGRAGKALAAAATAAGAAAPVAGSDFGHGVQP